MRDPKQRSADSSQAATSETLIALVRLLARQAAHEFIAQAPAPDQPNWPSLEVKNE